ncbi:hypothetical protein CCMA1212_008208 [Trichoderma ghanense]|uniref:Uncharacterized protein n=1 Tax=Trichoderma ghanense TaxID=65468 RepID=A0ABY2GY41_9HYPO
MRQRAAVMSYVGDVRTGGMIADIRLRSREQQVQGLQIDLSKNQAYSFIQAPQIPIPSPEPSTSNFSNVSLNGIETANAPYTPPALGRRLLPLSMQDAFSAIRIHQSSYSHNQGMIARITQYQADSRLRMSESSKATSSSSTCRNAAHLTNTPSFRQHRMATDSYQRSHSRAALVMPADVGFSDPGLHHGISAPSLDRAHQPAELPSRTLAMESINPSEGIR